MKEKLKFQKTHEWVLVDGNDKTARIGITSYAAMHLGEIKFIDLPEVNQHFKKGDIFATIESMKTTSELYMPANAMVINVNASIVDDPGLVTDDPFNNWFIEIKYTNLHDFDDLLTVDQYEADLP